MRIAICPGSFDPVTKGHIDIIVRAAELFDRVIVCVLNNLTKQPFFDLDERMDYVRRCTADIPNAEVDTYDGLLADYAREKGAVAIVKGLRAVSDFEYEFQMALFNRKLNDKTETVFLTTRSENMYLSSSIVKQVAHFGGDISDLIPDEIARDITQRLSNR